MTYVEGVLPSMSADLCTLIIKHGISCGVLFARNFAPSANTSFATVDPSTLSPM